MDLGIINGLVYLEGQFREENIYIKNGRIEAITKSYLPCEEEFDAEGAKILPGFIDPHVHFHLKVGKNTSKDDFYTGSVLGALGGVTTYIDFLDPIQSSTEFERAFRERMELAASSATDYSFHTTIAAPKEDAAKLLKAGIKAGLPSLKLFTTYSDTDRRTYDRDIDRLLQVSSELKGRIVIHAENDTLIDTRKDILIKDHEKARPVLSERTEILKLAEMAKEREGQLYIVHVSAGSSVKLLAQNYQEELKKGRVLLESCPHYFFFHSGYYEREDGYLYTMTPPLREEKEMLLLREQVDNLTAIGTDHCPFDNSLKREKYTSQIPMGIGGLQYSFLTMYEAFGEKIISKYTEGPAKAYGLYPRKGTLLPGADADIVILKGEAEHQIQDEASVYNGNKVKGSISHVFLRGEQIVRNGKFLGGKGRFLKREL
jgi:dihydropyrimidinase